MVFKMAHASAQAARRAVTQQNVPIGLSDLHR
jgi:hypothetical protein